MSGSSAKNYHAPGGDRFVVGGRIELVDGGAIYRDGQPLVSRAGAKVVAIGDSITVADTDVANQSFGPRSWFIQMIARSGGLLQYVRNSGISGNTTAQMLARIDRDVIAYQPDICFILGGTNDVGADVPTSTIVANIEAMVDKLQAANILPIIGTIPVRNDVVKNELLHKTNVDIRELAYRRKLTLVDFYAALADPQTGLFRAGFNFDNLHTSALGAEAMAKAALDKVIPLLPQTRTLLPVTNIDTQNMLTNALFYLDDNGDGLPNGWVSYGSSGVSVSIVDKPGIVGKAVKMEANSNTGGFRVVQQEIPVSGGKFAPGDKIAVCGKFIAEMAGPLDLKYGGSGVTFLPSNKNLNFVKDWDIAVEDGTFYFETVVPPDTTTVQVKLVVSNGTGVVYWGQIGLYNLSAG